MRRQLWFYSVGAACLVLGAAALSMERLVVVSGLNGDVGKVHQGTFKDLEYTVQNLTPFRLKLISRLEGCSTKNKIEWLGPFGRLRKTGTIEASKFLDGKHSVNIETVGYRGESSFYSQNYITFKVVEPK